MIARLRLASGLVLFTFVLTHLLNHAVGIVSPEAMDRVRAIVLWPWLQPPGMALLAAAGGTHVAIALWSVLRRRSLAMPAAEAAQLLLGFAIPVLLVEHVLGTAVSMVALGLRPDYRSELLVNWVVDPAFGVLLVAALLAAWSHAMIGLRFWLRNRRWYAAAQPWLFAGAILVPTLALVGVFVSARAVAAAAGDPAWVAAAMARIRYPGPVATAFRDRLAWQVWTVFGAAVALVLAGRIARAWLERRRGLVRVSYPDGRQVALPPGGTVLEASRSGGIPHASVCGGKGRCSTCRVRVGAGREHLPPPSSEEARVLERIAAPPNVRLACQLRPAADIAVTPLLPPTIRIEGGIARHVIHHQGEEREVAILFADLRAFTRMAEHRLPYDVVFVLNRYFEAMGRAVERAGGSVDKFIGDGVMALFGADGDPAGACRQALAAARAMTAALADLNRALAHDLGEPLKIGIGIHVGPVILGEMGYGRATSLTAIGDAVNTASRLEALTKEYGAELVVSQDVADRAGVRLYGFVAHDIAVRGRARTVRVRVVPQAAMLAELLPELEAAQP